MNEGFFVIIVMLQIAIVIWLIGVTSVYHQIIDVNRKTTSAIAGSQKTIIRAIRAICDDMELCDRKLGEYKASVEADKEQMIQDKKFAIDTIQQARKVYRTIYGQTVQTESEADA